MKTLILAILLFAILIFPHELGHFIVAKAVGIKVNEFSFGMGPALFHKQKGETLYSIRVFPIGGYCAMEGEDGGGEDERSFDNKPVWAKLLVLVAGAGMNLIISVLILTGIMLWYGSATTTLADVPAGQPAYEAGIRAGDEIVAIDDVRTETWSDISRQIQASGETMTVTYLRDGQETTVTLVPERTDEGRIVIGIASKIVRNPIMAIQYGITGTGSFIGSIFESLKMLITGEASLSDVSGPVGMVELVHETSSSGMRYFLILVALISVNLAIMNMLPLPALDGGRIIFVLISWITGKKISERVESAVNMAGFAFLIFLMLLVTFSDITKLFS